MNLVFDVGNTEMVIGLFEGEVLRTHWRLATESRRTPDEYGLMLRQLVEAEGVRVRDLGTATVGSVVPTLTTTLGSACQRFLALSLESVHARTPLPIRLDVDEPLTVGADRIVNTLAASRLYRADAIVVDLGTATTYDCITADGVFVGGVISPGVRTGAERLTERTAKLPRVDLRAPPRVIGRRTEECMQSGIFYGAVDAIDGTVRRIRQEWGKPDARVIATGGLAALIGPYCTTVETVDPFLTLHGIRFAREHMDGTRGGISEGPAADGSGS